MNNNLVDRKPGTAGRFVIRFSLKVITATGAALLLLLLHPASASAQVDTTHMQMRTPVDMAGIMRSNGKIYVVVAVLLVILFGLFGYVVSLDRKISRLEKNKNTFND